MSVSYDMTQRDLKWPLGCISPFCKGNLVLNANTLGLDLMPVQTRAMKSTCRNGKWLTLASITNNDLREQTCLLKTCRHMQNICTAVHIIREQEFSKKHLGLMSA